MASISVAEMRLILCDAYPGKGWRYRVMNVMHDNQVIAVYASYMERREKIQKMKKENKGHWEQMTLDEFMEELNAT